MRLKRRMNGAASCRSTRVERAEPRATFTLPVVTGLLVSRVGLPTSEFQEELPASSAKARSLELAIRGGNVGDGFIHRQTGAGVAVGVEVNNECGESAV